MCITHPNTAMTIQRIMSVFVGRTIFVIIDIYNIKALYLGYVYITVFYLFCNFFLHKKNCSKENSGAINKELLYTLTGVYNILIIVVIATEKTIAKKKYSGILIILPTRSFYIYTKTMIDTREEKNKKRDMEKSICNKKQETKIDIALYAIHLVLFVFVVFLLLYYAWSIQS